MGAYMQMGQAGLGMIQSIHQARNDAQDAEFNETVAGQNARLERQQGGVAEERQRREAAQLLGKQRAAMLQNGTGAGGSNLDVARQSAVEAELDALNIRYNSEVRAHGYDVQAQQYRRVKEGNQKVWDTFNPFGKATKLLSGPGAWVGKGGTTNVRGFLAEKGGY